MAYNEIKKFQRMLNDRPWPEDMKDIREAIQDQVVYDKVILTNKNNMSVLLPALVRKYEEVDPNASFFLKRWATEEGNVDVDGTTTTDDESGSSSADTPRALRSRGRSARSADCTDSQVVVSSPESEPLLESQTLTGGNNGPIDESVLSDRGIIVENKSWETYDEEFGSEIGDRFQLLLTEPPLIDEDGVKNFIAFTIRVLVPQAYAIVFVPVMQYKLWADKLSEASFNVMGWPFVVHRGNQSSNRNKTFPQDACEFAVIARAPSNLALERNEFKPGLETPYCEDFARFSRSQAIVGDVPKTKFLYTSATSKKKVCVTEKSIRVLEELIGTFCPAGGRVFDPFAGTLTTLIAAARTHHPCVGLESDSTYLDVAKKRLITKAAGIPGGLEYSQNSVYPSEPSTPLHQSRENNIEPEHVTPDGGRHRPAKVTMSPVTSEGSSRKTRSYKASLKLFPSPTRQLPSRTGTPHRNTPKRSVEVSPVTAVRNKKRHAHSSPIRSSPRLKRHAGPRPTGVCTMTTCILETREGAVNHKCFTCEASVHIPCAGKAVGRDLEEKNEIFCSSCLNRGGTSPRGGK